jgi:hypothetical protein
MAPLSIVPRLHESYSWSLESLDYRAVVFVPMIVITLLSCFQCLDVVSR